MALTTRGGRWLSSWLTPTRNLYHVRGSASKMRLLSILWSNKHQHTFIRKSAAHSVDTDKIELSHTENNRVKAIPAFFSAKQLQESVNSAQASTHYYNLILDYPLILEAFTSLESGDLQKSFLLVQSKFPPYIPPFLESVWKYYLQYLLQTELVASMSPQRMENILFVANVLSGKKVTHRATWNTISTLLSYSLLTAQPIEHLSRLCSIYRHVGYHSDALTQVVMKRITPNLDVLEISDMANFAQYLSISKSNVRPFFMAMTASLTDAVKSAPVHHYLELLEALANAKISDEDCIRNIARYIHKQLSNGLLTPWEKAKLVYMYSLLRFEHFTLCRHISNEVLLQCKNSALWNFYGTITSNSNKEASQKKHQNELYKFFEEGYEMGLGQRQSYLPSGVWEDVKWPTVLQQTDLMEEVSSRDESQGCSDKHSKRSKDDAIASTQILENEKLYSVGQLAIIVDSLIYLKLHHKCNYIEKLVKCFGDHLIRSQFIQTMDPLQITKCMAVQSIVEKKLLDEEGVHSLASRMISLFLHNIAAPSHVDIFLKYLVKWRTERQKVKVKKFGYQYVNKYHSISWLFNKETNEHIFQPLCKHLCEYVQLFTVEELASIIRSLAYLDFTEENFYKVFVPFFKERLNYLTVLSIRNITEAFNKRQLQEPHLFYLMGLQFQKLQAHRMTVKHRGILYSRIG